MKKNWPLIINSIFLTGIMIYLIVIIVGSVCDSYDRHFGWKKQRPHIRQQKKGGMSREEWERTGPKPTPPPSQSDRDRKDRQGGWKY